MGELETNMPIHPAIEAMRYADAHRCRVGASVTFERQENGDVLLTANNLNYSIPANIWASVVLTMTEFNERPGDWQAFLAHHMGQKDMLVGQRGGY